MKKIALVAIVVGLLAGGTVLASSKENSPVHWLLSTVQVLEEKLASLEERLNNVQTTPGPQGEQGPQGEVGPMGPEGPIGEQGLNGSNGMNLHLLDANGQDLGILLDSDNSLFKTYLNDLNVILDFRVKHYPELSNPQLELEKWGIYFTGYDCTNEAFIANDNSVFKVRSNGNRHFKLLNDLKPRTVYSVLDVSNSCYNVPPHTFGKTTGLEEITLPFTQPLAWPPRIELE